MTINQGLEGIVVAETKLSKVDGLAGKLTISGFPLEELAPNATSEEVFYLLWNGNLPNSKELSDFSNELRAMRSLNEIGKNVLGKAAQKKIHTMDALRLVASTLVLDDLDPLDNTYTSTMNRAKKMTAAFPTIIANYWRLKDGQEYIPPRMDLDHASNFLYMLYGEVPEPKIAKALEIYLNTVADHGLNASTFTARVITSTDSDVYSAIAGAIGALKGPKHGGAPGPALDMIFDIGEISKAEPYIRNKLEKGERIMGFGHRVYKVRDPRAEVLGNAAREVFVGEKEEFYNLVREIETIVLKLIEEYKPGRSIQTNVEFFTALILHGCGLNPDIFSSIFAMGRIAGWCAHVIEQQKSNRLMRPKSEYTGDFDKKWIKIDDRI